MFLVCLSCISLSADRRVCNSLSELDINCTFTWSGVIFLRKQERSQNRWTTPFLQTQLEGVTEASYLPRSSVGHLQPLSHGRGLRVHSSICFRVEGKGALAQTTHLKWCDKSCLNYIRERSHQQLCQLLGRQQPWAGWQLEAAGGQQYLRLGQLFAEWASAHRLICTQARFPSTSLFIPLTKEFEVDLIYKSRSINFYPLLCQYSICHVPGDLSTVNHFHFPVSAEYSREQVSVQNPKGLPLPFLFRVVYCL